MQFLKNYLTNFDWENLLIFLAVVSTTTGGFHLSTATGFFVFGLWCFMLAIMLGYARKK